MQAHVRHGDPRRAWIGGGHAQRDVFAQTLIEAALTMVFKLCQSASKKWPRLDGSHQIAEIIQGVKFKDGEKLTERAA